MSIPYDFPEYFLDNPPKFTEDGFCKECGEFHNECMCESFWIRLASSQSKYIKELKKKINKLEELLEENK